MWSVVVLLLSTVLYCDAQINVTGTLKPTVCDDIELSQEEKSCYINFTRDMFKAYGSLATSVGNAVDSRGADSNVAVYLNAIIGVFGKMCNNDVCLNAVKRVYGACKV